MPVPSQHLYKLAQLKRDFDKTILNRGFKIFQEEGVTLKYYDPWEDTYYFEVFGNTEPFYEVTISMLDDDEEEYEYWDDEFPDYYENEHIQCDCMYFEENLQCKHTAAAIYYLEFNKNQTFIEQRILDPFVGANLADRHFEKTPTTEEFEFPLVISCQEEDIPFLGEKIDATLPKYHSGTIRNVCLFPNGIDYSVEINGYTHFLKVKYENGKITINGEYQRKYLIKTGLEWLKYRFTIPNLGDLKYLSEGQKTAAITERLLALGIKDDIKEPYEAFQFEFIDNQTQMIPKGPIRGLYKVDAISNIFQKKVSVNGKDFAIEKIKDSPDPNEFGTYNVGLALVLGYNESFGGIIPFMAKGTKNIPTAFSVKFSKIEDPYDLRLSQSDNLEKILFLIDKINQAILKKNDQKTFSLFGDFLGEVGGYPIFQFRGYPSESDKLKKKHFDKPLIVSEGKVAVKITKSGNLYESTSLLQVGSEYLEIEKIKEDLDVCNTFAVIKKHRLLTFETPQALKTLSFFEKFPIMQFVENNLDQFINQLLIPMSKNVKIIDESGVFTEVENYTLLQRQLYITELSGLVIFRPEIKYGPQAFSNPLEGNSIIDPESKTIYLRDEDFEDEFVDCLRELHPHFKRGGNQGFFHLTHEAFMENLWFIKTFEHLKQNQVAVFGLENIKIKKYSPFPPVIAMEFGSTQDWFEVSAQVAFGNNKVKLKDIKRALDRDQNFIALSDGSIGILPDEWIKKFNRLFRSGETEKEDIRISKTQFNLLDDLPEMVNFPEVLKEIEEKKEKLKKFTEIKQAKVPKKLHAELRNYQHVGLNWLNFLQEYGWGGILADDMGLGKTLQLIALICKIAEKKNSRILVVAPTTLLFNWKDEIEKFAPHLDYFIHHGNRYENVDDLQKHQVLLTSYGLVINDLDLLHQIEFDAIIADESQAIKNTHSQRYKAITKLKGKLKIAMTGTPIENSLAELYAQMNFVNPGFFSSFSGFRDNYLTPLKKGNPEILAELQKKIKPFILRRTKSEVLTELPEKTEEYLYCEMDPLQRKIYDAYRNEYRDYLLKKFEEEGADNSKMYVLEGLTRLRQVCDATHLVSHTESKQSSAKIDLLLEHVTEKTGNHKILIFSQFVKMLDIVQQKLKENLIDYTYLDGKTSLKERESRVNQFQNDANKRVFLISLKAGGTGLNLTEADYVYILDPWWNPAVENQAIDRCYRMGQEKHVIAYRMICKNTVEEKIMQLQQAKSKMAKEVISEGDSFLGSLDGKSMLELFD